MDGHAGDDAEREPAPPAVAASQAPPEPEHATEPAVGSALRAEPEFEAEPAPEGAPASQPDPERETEPAPETETDATAGRVPGDDAPAQEAGVEPLVDPAAGPEPDRAPERNVESTVGDVTPADAGQSVDTTPRNVAETTAPAEPAGEADLESEAEPSGFFGDLRSRMIIGSPMDADTRITFLLGALTLVVAVAVDVLRGVLGPPIETLAGLLPSGAVAVFAFGQFFAFTLVFRGLLQVPRHIRNAALAIAALVVFAVPALQDFKPFDFVLVLPIAALWFYADTKEQLSARASWRPAALTAAGLSAIFIVAGLIGNDAILIELAGAGALIAAVGLFAASTDIAEIVQVAGDALGERIGTHSRAACAIAACIAAAATAVAAAVVLGLRDPAEIAQAFGSGLAVVLWYALAYAMLVSIGRKRGLVVAPHVPYRSLLGIVVLFGGAFYAGVTSRLIADPATYDPSKLFTYEQVGATGLLLFVAFAIAFAIFGRRSTALFAFLGYGATVGVWWFVNFANQGATLVVAPFGIAFATPVVVLVALSWPKTRDRFTAVCRLLIATNLGFTGYTIAAVVFLAAPSRFEEGSLLQALVVLAALGWDVLTSKNVTLRHSAGWPRNARASFFIAYVSLVGLFVMMSSASSLVVPGTTTLVEHVFESEGFVAVGLYLFGAPLLLFVFALRMRAILQAPPVADAR